MTKIEIIELVQHRAAGGDMTADLLGKFHENVVEKALTGIINQVLFDLFRTNNSALDYFAKGYSVNVSHDTAGDLYYITLPKNVVQLPNNSGVRMVTPRKGQDYSIPIVPAQAQDTIEGLEVGLIDNKAYGFIEQNKVYFRNFDKSMTSLYVKIIIPFEEYADTDEVMIPGERLPQILDYCHGFLLNVPPEDVRNDNNTKQ